MRVEKKDLIQILGIGILLLFLILPSYWLSQFLLYKTSIYSFLGSFYVYLFPCCFLILGMIQGLWWQNKRIGDTPFAIWVIVFAMVSCFLTYQWIHGMFLSSLIALVGILLVHGVLAWIGFRLVYYGEN